MDLKSVQLSSEIPSDKSKLLRKAHSFLKVVFKL